MRLNKIRIIPFSFSIFCFSCAINTKWHPISVDYNRSYPIRNEGKMYKGTSGSPLEERMADVTINNDSSKMILSSYGRIQGDTVKIILWTTTPAYHYSYEIILCNAEYHIDFNYLTSGPDVNRKIVPEKFLLYLNHSNLIKGTELRGYTEYRGKCTRGCWNTKEYVIKGTIKVRLQ